MSVPSDFRTDNILLYAMALDDLELFGPYLPAREAGSRTGAAPRE